MNTWCAHGRAKGGSGEEVVSASKYHVFVSLVPTPLVLYRLVNLHYLLISGKRAGSDWRGIASAHALRAQAFELAIKWR